MSFPQPSQKQRRRVGVTQGSRRGSMEDDDKRRLQPSSRRSASENDYHNLPEITWNPEVFNFGVDDFLPTNLHMHNDSVMTSPPPTEGVPIVPVVVPAAPASNPGDSRKSSLNSNHPHNNNNNNNNNNDSASNNCSGTDQEARSSPPKKTIRPCSHCGKVFSRSYDLHRHESSHSSERPYACEHPGCTKKYKLRQDLKAHERSAHQGRGGGGAVVLGYWQGYEDRLYSM